MCGIAGIVDFGACFDGHQGRPIVQKMCDALEHRGPDGEGLKVLPHCILGHRRLAVIDLSEAGRQPMSNEEGDVWVVFNGEIYNHSDLQSLLESGGHQFVSRTDTEVLVHGYEEWGIEGLVARLRGMFAFALYDNKRPVLFIVRDRLGVKPLFLTEEGTATFFSSEINPLYRDKPIGRGRVRYDMLDLYLTFGHLPANAAFVDGITKVPPSSIVEISPQGTRSWTYWSLDEPCSGATIDQLTEELRSTIEEAVILRLESDVPLGSFLSGGIDS